MIAFQVSDMTSNRSAGLVIKAVKEADHRALVRVDMATFTVEIEESRATARELSDAINRLLANRSRLTAGCEVVGARTVGDVGYLDDDGFLYLTDRSTEDLGEEVKAVVQPMPGVVADAAFAQSFGTPRPRHRPPAGA